MGLFDRLRGRGAGVRRGSPVATMGGHGPTPEDADHLANWVAARRGVEAFVEPETTVTRTTVVLVAHDGEWTRRRVGSPKGARRLGRDLHIPVYDVRLVGYPQRMRDHTARQRILRKRQNPL